jgi:hypothetical protein
MLRTCGANNHKLGRRLHRLAFAHSLSGVKANNMPREGFVVALPFETSRQPSHADIEIESRTDLSFVNRLALSREPSCRASIWHSVCITAHYPTDSTRFFPVAANDSQCPRFSLVKYFCCFAPLRSTWPRRQRSSNGSNSCSCRRGNHYYPVGPKFADVALGEFRYRPASLLRVEAGVDPVFVNQR